MLLFNLLGARLNWKRQIYKEKDRYVFSSALVIMIPLILPMAVGYGIHPVHLGIIFLANMQIGYFTPPVGMNLFIASYRFHKPVTVLYASTIPFMFILMLAVLVITYWPALTLYLVESKGG